MKLLLSLLAIVGFVVLLVLAVMGMRYIVDNYTYQPPLLIPVEDTGNAVIRSYVLPQPTALPTPNWVQPTPSCLVGCATALPSYDSYQTAVATEGDQAYLPPVRFVDEHAAACAQAKANGQRANPQCSANYHTPTP